VEKTLIDLGFLVADTFTVGDTRDPEQIGAEIITKDGKKAILLLPTEAAVETAIALINAAQRQIPRLSESVAQAAFSRHAQAEHGFAIEAGSIRYDAEERMLIVSLGIGVLRLRLQPDGMDGLKKTGIIVQ
jgi:hypothetical protein